LILFASEIACDSLKQMAIINFSPRSKASS
jgi:hypothetical protein